MKRRPGVLSGAVVGVLVALTACTADVSPAPTPPVDSVPSPSETAPVVSVMDGVLSRADVQVSLPESVTPMEETGLVLEPIPIDGPASIAQDGEVVTESPMVDRKGTFRRVGSEGIAETIDPAYASHGEAGGPHGGAGLPVISADATAWMAYPDTGDDLNIADFVVYVGDRVGRNPRAIGTSTADIPDVGHGRNVAVAYWRERLTLIGPRAYWMDTVRVIGDVDTMPDWSDPEYALGIEVMSAPLDGSAPQRSTLPGWFHSEDLCTPVHDPALVYLDSQISQVPDSGTASVRRAHVAADGTVTSDDVVWSAPEIDGVIVTAASACADTVAVAWTGPPDEETGESARVLEVVHDGTTTVIVGPDGGYFTGVAVTSKAVFFTAVNGVIDAANFVMDLSSGELWRISDTPGFYDRLHVSRTAVAWIESSTDDIPAVQVHKYAALVP